MECECVAWQRTLFKLRDACSDLNSADVTADEAGEAAVRAEDMATTVRRNKAVSLSGVDMEVAASVSAEP